MTDHSSVAASFPTCLEVRGEPHPSLAGSSGLSSGKLGNLPPHSTGFIVVGTDTDSGKTGFCAQLLQAFPARFAYWKPVETGESDTATIRRLAPEATVFEPLARFTEPVAPMLAAAREGRRLPSIAEVIARVPDSPLPLVIETFGGPLSPFDDGHLQAELIAALGLRVILVTSSKVGAVARTLQALAGMRSFGVTPSAVVLLGSEDAFAVGQIECHGDVSALSMEVADTWDESGIREAVERNRGSFDRLPLSVSERGPGGEVWIERDRASVWHPYTPLVEADEPLVVTGAQAEFLELAGGRRLIDGISSWWTILHGHRHPPLMAALADASKRIDHVHFAGVTHPDAIELAERLLATSPWSGGRVFFSDNGSTAVEVALKMAYQTWCHRGEPQRTLFVGFEHGYHGDTFGAMAVGRDPLFSGRFDPLLFETVRVPLSADRLDETLQARAGRVAAVILEPLVQGAGGMQMHTPALLKQLFDVCRAHGVLFIADEVMTGCGRTGSMWAFDQAGIAPDLICTSKTLAGGVLPLAATLVAPEIVAEFRTADRGKTFFHGHSFTGHPLACAVAVANLRELETGRWIEDVRRIEAVWRGRLLPLNDRPGIGVRILGSIAAIEFESPGGYLAEIGRTMRSLCLDRGVLLRPLGNALYAMPPYRTSDESLHRIAEAMIACAERSFA